MSKIRFESNSKRQPKKRQAIEEGGLILTLESAAGDALNDLFSAGKDTEVFSNDKDKQAENANNEGTSCLQYVKDTLLPV